MERMSSPPGSTPLTLAAAEHGSGRPVVILHGLFGSARNWASIAKRLAATHHVYALDLRNHGASPWAETMRYSEMAEDVRAFLRDRGLDGTATLLGHSLGGKVAMVTALRHPDDVARLVVVDVAPVAYPMTLLPYVRAMRTVDLDAMTRRSEVEPALSKAVPDPAVRLFLLQNLVVEDGRLKWRLNLPVIEREMPELSGFPEFPAGTVYTGPTLFVAGERSDYIRPEHRVAIERLFPNAGLATVPDAGHWVHAERPEAFLETLRPFLTGDGEPKA